MTDPHPQRCETCESFHEERQTPRYRCSWNCCYVHPKDECPCRPSHWEANHSASEPVAEKCEYPEDCRRPADRPEARIARQLADMLEYLESLRQQEEP
jgi:hypothetical protein